MSERFKVLLQEYSRQAETHLEAIRACPPEKRDRPFLHIQLLKYVRAKFMLDPEECASERLTELSEASIAKVTQIPKGQVAEQDISMNCAGISSAETKKILLLIALQRALEIHINPERAPAIQTIHDLADAVGPALEQKDA